MARSAATLPAVTAGRASRRGTLPLRAQVALVIALLSGLPNIVLVATVLLPAYRRAGELSGGVWLTVALWVVGVVALSALVGYLLSGQLLAPLLKVTRDIDVLPKTAPQLVAARVAVAGDEPAEVLALKRSFNALLEQVEVEQARRNAFMAALMHDLKTPLIAATNLLSVVRDDDALTRERRVEAVSHLTRELSALSDLVQKMVDAHRLERPDVPLSREPTEIHTLVRRVIERLGTLAHERGIRIDVHGASTAIVDAREIERALYNLLSNAMRYARSAIEVEVFQGMVRIRDDGPGLPAPLDGLAQPFNGQGVEIAGRKYASGTGGLGLFIARRALEAHGGRLVAEATGPGGTVLLAYLGREGA